MVTSEGPSILEPMGDEEFSIYQHQALLNQRKHNNNLMKDSEEKCQKRRGVGTTIQVGTTVFVQHPLKKKTVKPNDPALSEPNDPALSEVYKAKVVFIDPNKRYATVE